MVAHDIASLMRYKNMSLEEACEEVVHHKLAKDSGGLIAIYQQGNVSLPFNSDGMYRAWANNSGREIAIY